MTCEPNLAYGLFCKTSELRRVFTFLLFSRSVASDLLQLHGLQCSRPPCPSPSPRAYSNSCPLSQWYYPTISSSVIRFLSWLQSFPASGSFPMSQLFVSGGQSIGASVSVLPSFTCYKPLNSSDMGQHSTFFHGHEREEWQMVQKSLAGHRLYLWYWMPCSPISISSFQKQWVQRLVAKTKQETLNLSREVRWLLQTGNGPFHLSQPHSSQDTKVSELPSKPDSSQKKGKDKQS